MPGKWWIICSYSVDLIYLLSHIVTQRYKVIHKYTKCIPELCGFCLCVCSLLCVATSLHLHVLYLCIYTRACSICSYMFLCVCLWLYFVSWWRAGSREAETQEAPNKIGSDSLPQCWWKIWLFPSSGVGVWYFKLPSLWQYARQNKVYKNSQMLSEEKSWRAAR